MNVTDIRTTTWGKVKGIVYDLAVLPWGATEPHNYHLPYLTDTLCARNISLDALQWAVQKADINGLLLPPIALGSQNPGQRENAGCISTRFETQKAILSDIVESLDMQGINILIIVNGHGGNSFKQMIRDLTLDFPDTLIACVDWFAIIPQEGYFEEKDDHAGEMETSVMLYYHPELVNMSEAGNGASKPFAIDSLNDKTGWIPRDWAEISSDTGVGNPKKATAEKGERYAKAVAAKIGQLLVDLATKSVY